ncbi:MAG TPA: hypothetical protein PKD72_06545 [Gemmatales bacterium]|nr:hypothetical protein [Gemmatales bacterium]
MTCVFEKSVEHNNQQHQLYQRQFALAVARLKNDLGEYDRLRSLTKFLWRKVTTPAAHLLEIFSRRYEALLHERLVSIYNGLAARCQGFIQDLRQCRSSLLDLRQAGRRQDELWRQDANPWKTIVTPPGFSDFFQVVQQISDSISPEDLETIDMRLAEKLASSYPSLVDTSLATEVTLHPLRKLIQEGVQDYLDVQVPRHDVLELLLEDQPSICEAIEKLHKESQLPIYFHQRTKSFELVFVALPPEGTLNDISDSHMGNVVKDRHRLESEIRHTFPDLVTVQGIRPDEVILQRAVLGLNLGELSVMSEAGQAAYETAKGIENFSPHTRQDIPEWNQAPSMVMQ